MNGNPVQKRRVVVTGLGVLAPNGNDLPTFWEALIAGRSGVGPITRFDTSQHRTTIAAEVKGFDPEAILDRKDVRRNDAFTHYAICVAREAASRARLDMETVDPERVGVIWGSGIGGIQTHEDQHTILLEKGPRRISPFYVPMMISDMAPGMISMDLGAKGPNYGTVSACSSAAHALGESARKIQYGEADVMVTGGSEAAVTPISMAGFSSAKALSTRNDEPERASRPFDAERDGFVLGEGAGAVILEELEHAQRRGAEIYGEFLGLGFTADAYHQTAMAPEAEGGARAMRIALQDGGLDPSDIGYVNAHGTSTPHGRPAGDCGNQDGLRRPHRQHGRKFDQVDDWASVGCGWGHREHHLHHGAQKWGPAADDQLRKPRPRLRPRLRPQRGAPRADRLRPQQFLWLWRPQRGAGVWSLHRLTPFSSIPRALPVQTRFSIGY